MGIFSIFGIVKGLVKTVEGLVEQDGEKIAKGLSGTAMGVAGTTVSIIVHPDAGQGLSDASETITDDDA
jgi:hypothetical protein